MSTATAGYCKMDAPLAGRMTKMATLPFGRSKWQSRYFVLLDSELRSYKDEHAVSPSSVLNLCQIRGAVAISADSHSYCIRLEPRSDAHTKPWTVSCSSQVDLAMWLSALRTCIDRLYFTPPSSPKRSMTLSWLRKSSITPFLSSKHSSKSTEATTQEEPFYHAITHDECSPRPRPQKAGPVPSLSRRRGIVLAPIIIESSPFQQEPTESDDGISSLIMSDTSSTTMPASPFGGLFAMTAETPPLVPQPQPQPSLTSEDRGLRSMPSVVRLKKEAAEVSPSFLYYKERFRLF